MSKKIAEIGDVLKIDLGDGFFAYGRVLDFPMVAFYSLIDKGGSFASIDSIVQSEILFKVWVAKHAFKSKKWNVIANLDLESELAKKQDFFKVDSISKKLFIYREGRDIPASHEQCRGLERAVVWDPEHIEGRLRDKIFGVSNKLVELYSLPLA